MVAEHSPLPWVNGKPEGHVFSGTRLVAGCMGHTSTTEPEGNEINFANSEFIVRACNNYGFLIDELNKIAKWLEGNAKVHEDFAARPGQFQTLVDSSLADAKNYRATAKKIRAVVAKAEVR